MALTASLVTKRGGANGTKVPKVAVVDVTIGAQTDYTVGTGFAGLQALLESTAKLSLVAVLHVSLRAAAGTARLPLWFPTGNSSVVRLFEARAAGAPFAEDEIEQADITATDILRVVFIGV